MTRLLLFAFVFTLAASFTQEVNAQCSTTATWTFDPPPVDGSYDSGQEVEVCVDITGYQDTGANWLHGIILNFPDGWDLLDYVDITPPTPCGGANGVWLFQESVTSSSNGGTYGPGFFYDVNSGGPMDGNPGNNWGDFCTNTTWSFCITIVLDDECGGAGNPLDGEDILPTIQLVGDGVSGSWGITGTCTLINTPTIGPVTLNCCDAESGTSPGTLPICNTTTDLFLELGPPVETGGTWTDPNGDPHSGIFDPAVDGPGEYTYMVLGTDDCESTTSINMQFIDLGNLTNIVYCGTANTTIEDELGPVTFPDPTWSGTWTDPNGDVLAGSNGPLDPDTSPAGTYTYNYDNAQNCPVTLTVGVSFAAGAGGGASSADIQVCTLDPPFNPLDSLGGTPLVVPGAAWFYNDLASGFLFFWANNAEPLIDPANYSNTATPNEMVDGYLVYFAGNPPCPPSQDSLYVSVFQPANTGEFTQASVCVTDAPFVLEDIMDGTVDPGYTWTDVNDPGATFPNNEIDPGSYPPNTTLFLEYAGGLTGSPCFSSSLLELTILPADADAGDFTTIDVCETDPPFCMTDVLNGTPQGGGVWSNSAGVNLTGCFFVPGTTPGGTYTYTVTSTCDTDSQNLVINVTPIPDPGVSGTLEICDIENNVPLSGGLGGTPATGGTWSIGGTDVGPTINGATVNDGDVFTYTVGTAPCTATAQVTIDLSFAPFAGTATADPQIYCDSDPAFSLFTLLDTPPSALSGDWTGPGGFTGTNLNPATAVSGTYTYTLTSPTCGADSESIDITIEDTPFPGNNATVTVCPNATADTDLFAALGGADAGGDWINVPAGGQTNGTWSPGDPGGDYTYEVTAPSGNCPATATVTVNVSPVPNPGTDAAITVCAGDAPFNLITILTGGPATNGIWFNPSNNFFGTANASFNPATHPEGTYTYSVTAPGCPPVTATVDVTVLPDANAGNNATVTLCENLGSIDLTSYLGGTPDPGGTWSVPNPYDITAICGTTENLTYTVDNGTCDDTAVLTLNVTCEPNAGGDGALTYCSDEPCFNLSGGLTGPFDAGGTWTDGLGNTVGAIVCPNTLGAGTTAVYTYTVNGGACTDATAEVTVTITPSMTAVNINPVCQANQNFYEVSFQINGGTAPYEVDNTAIAGNSFTSAPIAAGTAYSFTVSDASGCADIVVSGPSPACICLADAEFADDELFICQGEDAFIQFTLTGNGPFTVSVDDGTAPFLVPGINSGEGVTVSPAVTTTYEITSVDDANCTSAVTDVMTVFVDAPVNAGPDTDVELCSTGGNIALTALLDPGAQGGGQFFDAANQPISSIPNTPASSGIYTYVLDGGNCPDDEAIYTIDIFDPIQISGIDAACNAAQTDYTVTFTITGGNGNYEVDNVAIAGNTFTSALIPEGTNYSFTVSDTGPCGDETVAGTSPNCDCPATAAWQGGNESICLGASVDLILDLGGDGPFDVTYEENGTPQTLNNISDGHILTVSPTATSTYALTVVNDQNCTGSAAGSVTINVETPPTAGPDIANTLCGGTGNLVLADFLDPAAGPGFFEDAGNVITTIPNNAASSGDYTYIAEGSLCPDDDATYTFTIFDPITATGVNATCTAAQTDYEVEFVLNGGNGNYLVNGNAIAGNTFTSALIPVGTPYSFTISDTGPCGDITINGNSPNCDCPATASFTGGDQTICIGETTSLPLGNFAGDGPWSVTYSDGVTTFPAITANAGDNIDVSPTVTTTYTLVGVEDQNCTGNASGSITVTVDVPGDAGPDVTEVVCGGGGNIALTTFTPAGADAGGTFFDSTNTPVPGNTVPNNAASSGIYAYVVDPNSCPADEALYDITINDPITVTGLTNDCNLAQTEYTVSFTINGGNGNYLVNGSTVGLVGNTFTSNLIDAADSYSFTISDDGPCDDLVVEDDSPNCECLATGSIAGTASICEGGCADITLNLEGVGPFSVTYINSNDPGNPVTLSNQFNGNTFSVCPGTDATYTLVDVTDSNCSGSVEGNPVDITVDPPLNISNETVTCDDIGETYTVTFNVTGGVAPIIITPAGGNFNATTGLYTSPAINSGQGYNYTISEAGACGNETVSGEPFSCPCTTDAGTLQNVPIELCTNESAAVIPNGDVILDGNDVYQFALHDGSATELGNILVLSDDGTFAYSDALETGVTYYISAIAGNENFQGDVNLNDPCFSFSNGVSILFNPLPTAVFAGDVTVCAGQPADLVINFTGNGPWTYSYSIDGGAAQGPFNSTGNSTTIQVTQAGTYSITEVIDTECSNAEGGQATVTNFDQPTASIGGATEVCENSGDGPEVTFTGAGPWTFEYSINGTVQPAITTTNNPYTIPALETGTFALISVSDANCVGTATGSIDVTFIAAPTAMLSGGGVICADNQATFTLALTGNGPWTVQYAVDGVPQPPIQTANPNHTFLSNVDGDYTITSVADAACSGPGSESDVSLTVNPLPTGEIGTNNNLLCIGQELQLSFALQGNPPFDLTYAINGDTIQLNGLPTNYTITLNPEEPVVAELLFISDGSTPTCQNQVDNSVFVQVAELPNAPVLADDTICADSGPVSIGVAAAPGFTYSWSPTTGLSDPNIANPTATLINEGVTPRVFTYVLTASNGTCEASDTVNITVDPGPRARFLFTPDPASAEDPRVFFLNQTIATPNTQYFWDFGPTGSATGESPEFVFPEGRDGDYPVTLTALDPVTGCSSTYTATVRVRRELMIYVPNAFTPDADGKNDLWGPVMTNIDSKEYRLTVYDRAGQIVFETTDVDQKWNGGHMNGDYYLKPGMYVWTIEGREIGAREDFEMKGNVILMR